MSSTEFRRTKNIHIFGIGGIGVSALARLLQHEGKAVSGQDSSPSPVTEELERAGVSVSIGQSVTKIPKGTQLVIYSLAIPERNPEFMEKLKKLPLPLLSYPQALGFVSKDKRTIAIAGTHGKTTTTAMVAEVLMHASLEPSVIVGSLLKKQKTNFIPGKGRHLVVEADEYQRSFLNLSPYILVITNIGEDHLDYYKDVADIQSAFCELASKVPKSGFLITRTKDDLLREVIASCKGRVIDYTDFVDNHIALPVPGKHNRENAGVALAVAHVLGIDKEKVVEALGDFGGTWRRFDFQGKTSKGALVYDDYAHNPDKIRAAIAGYREAYPKRRLTVIFQPHLYSRTETLLEGFVGAFDNADEVVVTPIFAAREKKNKSISSEVLVGRLQERASVKNLAVKVSYAPNLPKLAASLVRRLGSGDLAVTMGAGDIYQITDKLVKKK